MQFKKKEAFVSNLQQRLSFGYFFFLLSWISYTSLSNPSNSLKLTFFFLALWVGLLSYFTIQWGISLMIKFIVKLKRDSLDCFAMSAWVDSVTVRNWLLLFQFSKAGGRNVGEVRRTVEDIKISRVVDRQEFSNARI